MAEARLPRASIKRVAVIGAGVMGHGIAQVAAMAGCETRLTDADPGALSRGGEQIRATLAGAVARAKLTQAQADAALAHVTPAAGLATATRDTDVVIEAVLED